MVVATGFATTWFCIIVYKRQRDSINELSTTSPSDMTYVCSTCPYLFPVFRVRI